MRLRCEGHDTYIEREDFGVGSDGIADLGQDRKEKVASSGSRVGGWAAFCRGDSRGCTFVLPICLHAVIHLLRESHDIFKRSNISTRSAFLDSDVLKFEEFAICFHKASRSLAGVSLANAMRKDCKPTETHL
jgi:hypothetical protein